MSVIWIMGLSFAMLELCRRAGSVMNLPQAVMGQVIIAAGTSVPGSCPAATPPPLPAAVVAAAAVVVVVSCSCSLVLMVKIGWTIIVTTAPATVAAPR